MVFSISEKTSHSLPFCIAIVLLAFLYSEIIVIHGHTNDNSSMLSEARPILNSLGVHSNPWRVSGGISSSRESIFSALDLHFVVMCRWYHVVIFSQ
jgi:hypothetical protein